ncbi:hypothetical protein BU26DRAFT_146070 [Trematosphaeria pertusa]|uniref:Uncharacterized protein n=1 Tax=Trematosphaeria pertusa TaxID=390896 RepID=A0A6A6IWQ8_9PLEO|nr:uncharacterized protein BU26DRAFT_146070 [Trematosphaeria pertusa]KAF2254824.1 hypothetical protein BU26DRAFT_146070 [Trematosphaeria pertusa]
MDSGKGRKRPWEEDSPIDSQFKRRDPPTPTAAGVRPPPLPQHAGPYSGDTQTLSQRRLPPLYTPFCSASGGPLASSSIHPPSQAQDASESRPRSQSLFDVFQHPPRLWLDSGPARLPYVSNFEALFLAKN